MSKTGTFDQPFQFSTKRADARIGMVQYEFRNYLPAIGRWMTRDPLGEAGGLNLYAFVGNNPVNWVDPWGLESYKNLLSPCGAPESCFGGGGGRSIDAPIGQAAGLAMTGIVLGILDHIFHDESDEQSCPVPGTRPGRETKGRTNQREKSGDEETANEDFDNLNPSDVKEIPNGGRVGTLPDGRTIIVRPYSKEGRPTVEIQNGKARIKVRYGD